MEISHQDEVSLRLTRDGKRLLTLRGDCYYERLTFEVGEDVFLRCDSIIHATNIYQSKGYYEWKMMLLDAPTTDFHVTYTDDKESFSGSGDMPTEIWDGMHKVVDYLKSLREGRQAFGHLTTTYYNDPFKIPNFNTTVWTDGIIEYMPDEGSLEELTDYLNARYGLDGKSDYWITKYVEGCGMHCLLLENPYDRLLDVFVDKSTAGVTLEGADTHSSNWPEVYQRMITKGDLERIPTDSLLMLEKEVTHNYDTHTSVKNDLERQNTEVIMRYTERRMNEIRKSKSE